MLCSTLPPIAVHGSAVSGLSRKRPTTLAAGRHPPLPHLTYSTGNTSTRALAPSA
jgi:hypothetical protein